MSILPVVNAESVSLLIAKEVSLGTQPTTGWQTLQPNADGIDNYYLHTKVVARSPLSRLRQLEASEIVDADATPGLKHDLTKDFVDSTIEGWFLARAKHNGGTGTALFTNQGAGANITARTTTAYTVTAGGALQAGTLVVPRGWVTGANATANGTLQVVGAASTATSVTVASGVAETPAGAYAVTLEVAGFRGAAGDIQLNGSGNLISTVADFTTMGLVVGQWIWIGGTVGGGHDFATAAYRGYAKVTAVAANLVTLARRAWTVAAADNGATKTIDIYFGRWLRNVASNDADYLETSYQMELAYTKLSAGTTDMFAYAAGNLIDQVKISAGAQSLITADLMFVGTTIGVPTTSRATGASTAAGPLAIEGMQTVTKLLYERLVNQATEATVSDDIENSAIALMNHVTPQKQHGNLGTKRDVVGKCEVGIDATVFLTQPDAINACQNNTSLAYGLGLRNGDFGMFFDVPSVKCTDSTPKFPANGPVTLSLKLAAFRDATGNYTMGVTLFPFLPVL